MFYISIASGIWLTASHLGEDVIAGYAGITVVLPVLTTTHAWFMARDLREFSLRSDASRNWCEVKCIHLFKLMQSQTELRVISTLDSPHCLGYSCNS